ncbi:arsenate reductase [Pseudooceanicola antarcticus]|uniref:Arsenate reductase n=1 Tax=Pseudooceanicola antarcticus TaxID=1247613 RepID=A0A285ILG0_9RHOB|nr:arsenate reductase (glutaredoxin) [Pseudooceanicola antarcticus]PJE28592.1 arsenate reductase (glutaredoxin) [Pseudooceanicola antarcticus]SNY48850.1 arsenate reductase [Pseudooceanicola antarcticus]
MITLWHNPRCSKSRQALALLEEAGAEFEVRRYLDDAPSETELRALQSKLDIPVIEMMRVKEALFKELGLTRDSSEDALFVAMAAHPKLIERAVAINCDRAVIARPPERVLDVL